MSNFWTIASEQWFSLFKYSLYYIIGGLIVFSNSLIVIAIARHSALRSKKEYIMVGGLALADVLNGLAYTISGLYRSYLILTETDKDLVTPWECMRTVHTWFFAIGQPASGFFLVCVNVDRLIAVTYPMMYHQLSRRYAILMNCLFATFSMILAVILFISSYLAPDIEKYPRTCFLSHAFDNPKYFSILFTQGRMINGIISVLLFAVVWYKAKVLFSLPVGLTSTYMQLEKAKRQRRITVTIGISSVFTLILYVIPNICITLLITYVTGMWFNILVPLLSTMSNLNAVVNFLLYTTRHEDLWYGVKYLFTCQELTEGALAAIHQHEMMSKSHKIKTISGHKHGLPSVSVK